MADMWTPMGGTPMVPGSPGGYNPQGAGFSSPISDLTAPPPNGEEETKQREGGWAKVQAYMQNPDVQMGLLRMGLMMMQPIPVGQTSAGHVANALGSSVDYMGGIQQQRLLQEQAQARTQQTREETRNLGFRTDVQMPAEVKRIGAVTENVEEQTHRARVLLPTEMDRQAKELALLEWKVKEAPTDAAVKELNKRKAEVELDLKERFGADSEKYKNELVAAHAKYYKALSEGQAALTDKYKADADKGKGWKVAKIITNDETGAISRIYYDPQGRERIVTTTPGMSISDANRQAKADVNAMSREELNSTYPGLSKDQAITEESKKLRRGRTTVEERDAGGVPTQPPPTDQAGAPPIQPRRTQPVTPETEGVKEGSYVPDGQGGWWKREGKVFKEVPASEGEAAKKAAGVRGTGPAKPAAATEEPVTVKDAPPGMAPEVQQRYTTKAVRGSPSRFDHTAYDADLQELQNLVTRVESGELGSNIAIGRIKILSHKLGVPEPTLMYKPKQQPTTPAAPSSSTEGNKSKKLSFKVKRGKDGKIEGLDLEDMA